MTGKLIDLVQGIPISSSHGYLGWSTISILLDKEIILFDSGGFNNRGLLLKALKEININRKHIDRILLTHLHFDHCLNVDLFPNATVYVSGKELDYALSEEPSEKGDIFIPKPYIENIFKDHEVIEVKEGDTVYEGVKVVELPGHTPGSVGYLIEDNKILFTGDALRNTHELIHRIPTLCFGGKENWKKSIEKIVSIAKIIVLGHERRLTLEQPNMIRYLVQGEKVEFNFVIKGEIKKMILNFNQK